MVASLKPKEAAAPTVRFETVPGEQMQVEGRSFDAAATQQSAFGFCRDLGWSRASCVEFVTDERVGNLDQGARERLSRVRRGAPQSQRSGP
jgi:transposase